MADDSIWTILWRARWLVGLAVLSGVVVAAVVLATSSTSYRATSTIEVNAGSSGSAANVNPAGVQTANQTLAATYAALLTDRSFLAAIQPHVFGRKLTADQLASRISAHAVTNTSLLQLSASGPSAADARRLAGDVAQAFVASIRGTATSQTAAVQTRLQAQIDGIDHEMTKLLRARKPSRQHLAALGATRTALVGQLAALTASGIASGSSVAIAGPPIGSSSPVSPRPLLTILAGVLVGLLVGVALAWVRYRLDRGLRSAEEAGELLETPVLATVPLRSDYSSRDPAVREAYDVLRTNLAFVGHNGDLRVLAVSSSSSSEGKSASVEGLAAAAVRGGTHVLMIDGDVRTRALTRRLGHGSAPGLTSVLIGAASLEEAIVEIEPGLSFLPAGPPPPNPPSLLGGGAMRDLLARVRERYALVMVDAPPAAGLADASILSSLADGILLLARVGTTKRSDLPTAAATLRQVPTPLVGVVVLDHRPLDQLHETPLPARGNGHAPPPAAEPDTAGTL